VRLLGSPLVHGLMSAAALLGPGREVLAAGARAAAAGCPDMNTLVGLGAGAAFGVSCVAAALPALGWRSFFEEPAMLLGVVLLGRALEQRAKLQASADMTALRVRALFSWLFFAHPDSCPSALARLPGSMHCCRTVQVLSFASAHSSMCNVVSSSIAPLQTP
jgi:hypothetical protein